MLFENEVDLKKKLDSVGIRYDDSICGNKFVVSFVDNKNNNAILAIRVYNSPIAAIRDLGEVIKASQYPAEDIDICLEVAFDSDNSYRFTDIVLSPYLYYKKKEVASSVKTKSE